MIGGRFFNSLGIGGHHVVSDCGGGWCGSVVVWRCRDGGVVVLVDGGLVGVVVVVRLVCYCVVVDFIESHMLLKWAAWSAW